MGVSGRGIDPNPETRNPKPEDSLFPRPTPRSKYRLRYGLPTRQDGRLEPQTRPGRQPRARPGECGLRPLERPLLRPRPLPPRARRSGAREIPRYEGPGPPRVQVGGGAEG